MDLDRVARLTTEMIADINSDDALALYKYLESGKMIRSKLVLSIVNNNDAYRLCAIIELIQSASLLHDDVIDSSDLRRGKPSINAQFGNKNAIMLGDILYSRAFFELSHFPKSIAQSLSKSVVELSVGELEDVKIEKSFNESEERYLNMIRHKSASLIAASAECAALLKNQENTQNSSFSAKNITYEEHKCKLAKETIQIDNTSKLHKLYYDYGFNIGMAFQIIDDILDITQDSVKLGKPALSDFKTGKTTLPYIYLYHTLSKEKQAWLKSLFKQDLNAKDARELKTLLLDSPLQKAREKALEYGNKALNIASMLNNEKLYSTIQTMIERDF